MPTACVVPSWRSVAASSATAAPLHCEADVAPDSTEVVLPVAHAVQAGVGLVATVAPADQVPREQVLQVVVPATAPVPAVQKATAKKGKGGGTVRTSRGMGERLLLIPLCQAR